MPVTIRTGGMKYKDSSTGQYVGIDAIGGGLSDVQVNGTSVVADGVANIPVADANTLGLAKVGGNGLTMTNDGMICVNPATTMNCQGGSAYSVPITPNHQHDAVFFGLSKVAGADLKNETVTVGTYPETSKTAIRSMLGIEAGVSLVESVSGTTPSLTCAPNVRYVCGTVSTISITPPSSGTCDVIFSSGGNATVLTVPNTVKFPSWFDSTSLDSNATYEIMITDGVYGAVMSWAN